MKQPDEKLVEIVTNKMSILRDAQVALDKATKERDLALKEHRKAKSELHSSNIGRGIR